MLKQKLKRDYFILWLDGGRFLRFLHILVLVWAEKKEQPLTDQNLIAGLTGLRVEPALFSTLCLQVHILVGNTLHFCNAIDALFLCRVPRCISQNGGFMISNPETG